MVQFAKPMIPAAFLHDMKMHSVSLERDAVNVGLRRPSDRSSKSFKGLVMPLSNEDLQYLPEGTFTKNSQKLYTNGARLAVGSQFTDPYDDATYTVKQELTHGPLHPMQRYMVEKKGVAAAR